MSLNLLLDSFSWLSWILTTVCVTVFIPQSAWSACQTRCWRTSPTLRWSRLWRACSSRTSPWAVNTCWHWPPLATSTPGAATARGRWATKSFKDDDNAFTWLESHLPRAHLKCPILSRCDLQLGLGHSSLVKEATLVTALQGKNIRQISAGRCHSSAWTTPSTSTKNSGTMGSWAQTQNRNESILFHPHPSPSPRWPWELPAGPSPVRPPAVQHSERLQPRRPQHAPHGALQLLWSHVQVLEAAQPRPQASGIC